jgi:hypothetical protein
MKRLLRTARVTWRRLAAVLLILLAQGCASGRFLADRGNDASDIITCTVGVGFGVKARVGPVQVGALVNRDVTGLRGGQFRLWPIGDEYSMFSSLCEFDYLVISGDFFTDTRPDVRQKLYSAGGGPLIKEVLPSAHQRIPGRPYYYTQIEVVGGLFGSLRLGVNPGELADFLFGWFGVDFFHDDIGRLTQPDQNRHH